MKTIRKYNVGGPMAGTIAASPEIALGLGEVLPQIAIPAALAYAFYETYKHPERSAVNRGMQKAWESLIAAEAQLDAQEKAELIRAAIANNKAVEEFYKKELAGGPIVTNYENGATTTITGYDPNTGKLTVTMSNPRGWEFSGTAPELRYNYLNGVDFSKMLTGTVNTKYGTFTPEIDYIDWDTLKIKPGTLIEGLPGITTSQPNGLNSVTINPRAMTLSNGQAVVLPSTLPTANLYDGPADIYANNTVAIPVTSSDMVASKKNGKPQNGEAAPENQGETGAGAAVGAGAEVAAASAAGAAAAGAGSQSTPPAPNDPNNKDDKRSFMQKMYDVNINNPNWYEKIFQLYKPLNAFNVLPKAIGYGIPAAGYSELLFRPFVANGYMDRTPLEAIIDMYWPKKKEEKKSNEVKPVEETGDVLYYTPQDYDGASGY